MNFRASHLNPVVRQLGEGARQILGRHAEERGQDAFPIRQDDMMRVALPGALRQKIVGHAFQAAAQLVSLHHTHHAAVAAGQFLHYGETEGGVLPRGPAQRLAGQHQHLRPLQGPCGHQGRRLEHHGRQNKGRDGAQNGENRLFLFPTPLELHSAVQQDI